MNEGLGCEGIERFCRPSARLRSEAVPRLDLFSRATPRVAVSYKINHKTNEQDNGNNYAANGAGWRCGITPFKVLDYWIGKILNLCRHVFC